MATLFRQSQVWVLEFTYDGRPRRWFHAWPQGTDAPSQARALLRELYGERARLVQVRPATAEEERDYGRGKLPHNALCPTGRAPRSEGRPPAED